MELLLSEGRYGLQLILTNKKIFLRMTLKLHKIEEKLKYKPNKEQKEFVMIILVKRRQG